MEPECRMADVEVVFIIFLVVLSTMFAVKLTVYLPGFDGYPSKVAV